MIDAFVPSIDTTQAYIQNLETSRMKLAQLEQELTMARRQQVGNNP